MTPTSDNEIVRLCLSILWIFGGLGLFLYGIDLMGSSLRKAAGSVLRKNLNSLTKTRFHGLFTGTVMTGLLQSSSASTVMVVGFINAGLLAFSSSIGLILGANIGSTVTPQITALNIDELAIPFVGVGFLLNFLSKSRVLRQQGMALIGFGMLFLGLMLMKTAVDGYDSVIKDSLEACMHDGIIGHIVVFFVAMILTAVIQSSAATVVMLQALAAKGSLTDISIAIPIILGADIGTCITAMLASLKSSRSARKAAVAHLLFNVLAVFITMALYKLYILYIPKTASSLIYQIANVHVAIKVVAVLVFLPFTGLYTVLINKIMPGEDKLDAAPAYLDPADVKDPGKALVNIKKEIRRMNSMCLELVSDSVDAFFADDEIQRELVIKREDLTDDLYDSIAGYVLEMSKKGLPAELSTQPPKMMHIMGDVERVGDHAENIVELSQAFGKDDAELSMDAESSLRSLMRKVVVMGEKVDALFDDASDSRVEEVLQIREDIYSVSGEMISGHEVRLNKGECTVVAGIVFVDLITNLKRVANHLRNIAASLGSSVESDSAEL